MSTWYLNRYKNPPSEIRRKLNEPPYHIHQRYEDQLEKLGRKHGKLRKTVEDEISPGVEELKQTLDYLLKQINGVSSDTALLKRSADETKQAIDTIRNEIGNIYVRLKALENPPQ